MHKLMRNVEPYEFCYSVELLLSEGFKHIIDIATQHEKCFVQVDLLLQEGPETFQLFHLNDAYYGCENKNMESLIADKVVSRSALTIRKGLIAWKI